MAFFFEAKRIIFLGVLLPLRNDFPQSGLCCSTLNVVPSLVLEELFEGDVLGVHFQI